MSGMETMTIRALLFANRTLDDQESAQSLRAIESKQVEDI